MNSNIKCLKFFNNVFFLKLHRNQKIQENYKIQIKTTIHVKSLKEKPVSLTLINLAKIKTKQSIKIVT